MCECEHLTTEASVIILAKFGKHLSCCLIEKCKPEVLTPLIKYILCHFDRSDQILMGMILDVLLLLIVHIEQPPHYPEATLRWNTEAHSLQEHQN